MKVVSFIPIKLNNERLPGKNTKLLNGKPLCSYLFDTLLQTDGINERYVYCSDKDFLPYVPAGINFLERSKELDTFETKSYDLIDAFVKDVQADIYLYVHVTSPFIKKESLEKGIAAIVSGEHDSVLAVHNLRNYIWYQNKPVNFDVGNLVRTQDLEPIYCECGAFIFTRNAYIERHSRYGKNPFLLMLDEIEAVDIDTQRDFDLAEAYALVQENNKKIRGYSCGN